MTISIRNVDVVLFKQFKAEAIKEGVNLGEALNMAMMQWLSKNKNRKSLLEFKPKSWGKNTADTSEKVDEILYGKK